MLHTKHVSSRIVIANFVLVVVVSFNNNQQVSFDLAEIEMVLLKLLFYLYYSLIWAYHLL